jgi:hypothetical protein
MGAEGHRRARKDPVLTDVNSDQQNHGLETDLVIDRPTAARLGLTTSQIDNTLYDAFGQRQVSVIYAARNQYHVVMEVAPQFWQSPDMLKQIYVSSTGGAVKRHGEHQCGRRHRLRAGQHQQRGQRDGQQRGDATTSNVANGTVTNNVATPTVNNAASAVVSATASPTASVDRLGRGAQSGDELARQYRARLGLDLDRRAGQYLYRNHGAARRLLPLRTQHDAARGQSSGIVRRHHDLVQPEARRVAEPGHQAIEQAMTRLHVPATIHGSFAGHRPGLSAIAQQRAGADRRGAARRLYRAGRALRELRPPDHDPLDAALGRGRRGAGADAVRYRIQHHRADRRHPPDRHRQEERDHDDRLRPRSGARRRG